MSGETNLIKLLQSMEPILYPEEYVFCSVGSINPTNNSEDFYAYLAPIGLFRESEGTTLILKREKADLAALSYTSIFCMITLSVHSSLEAVGFLAAITNKLAQHNISVNPVSAYYHDHLFVPIDLANEAMILLQEFSK
ncbi:MAG: ACT domain-containing protein [Pleurocapsa sp.]